MIAGHFFLAFSLAALFALASGLDKEFALKIGVFAAMFAVLPDIDILYAFKEVFVLLSADTSVFVENFWSSSAELHRGISHSIVTGVLASTAFTLYHSRRSRFLALVIGLSAFLTGIFLGGALVAALMVVYVAGGILLSEAAIERISTRQFFGSSFLGLVSHPFGDLFTGTPPQLFYPLEFALVDFRIVLSQDPVVNLLSVFLIELSCLALALTVYVYLNEISLREKLSPFALAGFSFGLFHLMIPEPTLSSSYRFVYSITSLSLFLAVLSVSKPDKLSVKNAFPFAANFTAAMIAGFVSYTAVYLLLAL